MLFLEFFGDLKEILIRHFCAVFQYKSDLKRKRRLHALSALNKGASSKGEVTEQLACILKSLWSLQVMSNY